MKVEFRNLSDPISDYQNKYVSLLPYVIFVNDRNRKTFSWWVYLGWLGYCLAIELVSVPAEVGKEIEER